MEEPVHPLDRDDDEPEIRAGPKDRTTQQIILRYCVGIALVGGAVACIASVATANAIYRSPVQQAGEWVRWVAGIIALAACGGMLVAFRLKSIVAHFKESRADDLRRRSRPQLQTTRGEEATPPTIAQNPVSPAQSPRQKIVRNNPSYSADFGILPLIVVGFAYMTLAWFLALVPQVMFLPLVNSTLQLLSLGLCITMLVYNTGVTRAFAIGYLATALLSLFAMMSTFYFMLDFNGYSRNSNSSLVFASSITTTIAILSGWLSAGYVWLLQKLYNNDPSWETDDTES